MSFYEYEAETEDTFQCLVATHARDDDDFTIVLNGASDEQCLVFEQAANIFHETGKTPRQLAEENAKLREEVEDLKREVDSLYHSQREGR